MEKVLFENQECYVAYKAFENKDSLVNYKGNYIYELNHWYESLDVDTSDKDCSYGCNLSQTFAGALEYGKFIYKCYVPIKNNIIHLLNNQDKFRTKRFYLSDELIDLNKLFEDFCWDELTEKQKNLICKYTEDFDYKFYWDNNKLTEKQKNLICKYTEDFDYKFYWDNNKLTENQKDFICQYNKNFDYKFYWDKLTKNQKDLLKTRVIIKL